MILNYTAVEKDVVLVSPETVSKAPKAIDIVMAQTKAKEGRSL